jgi:hypothetical protein
MPFPTVDSITAILVDSHSALYEGQINSEYLPLIHRQAENMLAYIHECLTNMHFGISAKPASSGKSKDSINGPQLASLLTSKISPDNPIMSTFVDLSDPVDVNTTAPTWPAFYEKCNSIIAQETTLGKKPGCTLKMLVDMTPANTMTRGACLNHYINSPKNSQLKELLSAMIHDPAVYVKTAKKSTPSASSSGSTGEPNTWNIFSTTVKKGSNYTDIPIIPTPPNSADAGLMGQWTALSESDKQSLLIAKTMGEYEALAVALGFTNNWKNLLYAATKGQVYSHPSRPNQIAQSFSIPTVYTSGHN